ncbi:MAG: hypothetical protein KF819_14480 [Labilithrix sp.]|nr:hypothetical protein [Labilithrix sp.]
MRRVAWIAIASALVPAIALADVGPPDTSCTVEKKCPGQGVECRYVNSDPDAGELACMKDAKARGLQNVCARGGGTVGSHVYCPKADSADGATSGGTTSGAPSNGSSSGGSSSSCAASPLTPGAPGAAGAALAAVAICIARAWRGKRRSARRSPLSQRA